MSLTSIPLRRWAAIAALAAWIPQMANVWPSPAALTRETIRQDFREAVEMTKRYPENETLRANREAFEALANDPTPLIRELWIGWVGQVVLVLLGIASGFMAWRAVKFWRWAVAITALGYLWLY